MAKRYDPILCMMVDEPTKAQDELSLAQKKQVVNELKGFLKKSYNFSDESEYARAYEDLRHMFTTGSRKSISGLFENTVKKTGAHDAKAQDAMPDYLKKAGYEVGTVEKYGSTFYTLVYNGKAISTSPTEANIVEKAKKHYANRHDKAQDSASTLDKAIKTADAVEVETSRWSFSSGKSKPSGFGNWWFKIGTEEKHFSGNWSSAKAEAIKYAKEKGINRIALMT